MLIELIEDIDLLLSELIELSVLFDLLLKDWLLGVLIELIELIDLLD